MIAVLGIRQAENLQKLCSSSFDSTENDEEKAKNFDKNLETEEDCTEICCSG